MEVGELWELVEWIVANVTEPRLQKKYGALHNVLSQNTQPNNPKSPFEQPANELKSFLIRMPLAELNQSQLAFLAQIELAPYIGEAGAQYVEDTLYRNQLDIATAAARIQDAITKINKAIERTTKIREGLTDLIPSQAAPDDSVILRVTFSNDASIDNVVQLKNWSKAWHDISAGLSRALDKSPTDVLVVSVQQGSVIISLGLIYAVAKVANYIIERALQNTLTFHQIRHEIQKVKALTIANKQAEANFSTGVNSFEVGLVKMKEQLVADITSELAKQLKIKRDSDGDKHTRLERSVFLIVNFLNKGGRVDVIAKQDAIAEDGIEIQSDKQKALREQVFQEALRIRQMESEIKQIGYTPLESASEELWDDDDADDAPASKDPKKSK